MTWERFFDSGEPMTAFVAERGDELIGLVHLLYHRSTTALTPVCYLQDLFVLETERGRGFATALIEAVYDDAARAGSTRVYWQTREDNATARRLYDQVAERSGFVVYRKTL